MHGLPVKSRYCCWPAELLNLLLALSLSFAACATEAPDESWLEDDSELRALEVNEGELEFIPPPQGKPVLHAATLLDISAASLQTGWVRMHQCYRHLDAIARTEVVYGYAQMKSLRIERLQNIGSARVSGKSVQLEEVSANAELCVSAEILVLRRRGAEYEISHGPYHRRFLDGYYPYHVSLDVYFPADLLAFASVTPVPQPHFVVKQRPGHVNIDSWFEGLLTIQLRFREPR